MHANDVMMNDGYKMNVYSYIQMMCVNTGGKDVVHMTFNNTRQNTNLVCMWKVCYCMNWSVKMEDD